MSKENKPLNKHENGNDFIADASSRFSITKAIFSSFALFVIIDNEQQKLGWHLVCDNGEQYCDEMVNKMLAGLNG